MDKKILLIADDDEMNRKVIHRFLSGTYEILEAEDGRKALDIIEKQAVDALLLDIVMPEVDGLEVLSQLRADTQYDHIGILVATSTKEKTERAALSLGADDIVAKPYDPIVIKKRLENILLMKEVKKDKEILQSADAAEIEKNLSEKYSAEVKSGAKKIHSLAQIIRSNKDNFKLVAEMADSLDDEANRLTALFADEDK